VDFKSDTVCHGNITTFTDLSDSRAGEISSRQWDFGDGTKSDVQNPVHFFSGSGIFYVKLIVTVNTIDYSRTKQVIVKPKPVADFTYTPLSVGGELMKFDNLTETAGTEVTEWKWDFGDGSVFYGRDPSPHGYLSTGFFTVRLSITCSNGCADSVSKKIQVCHGLLEKPLIYVFGPNVWYLVCSNDTANYYRWYYNGNLRSAIVSSIPQSNPSV